MRVFVVQYDVEHAFKTKAVRAVCATEDIAKRRLAELVEEQRAKTAHRGDMSQSEATAAQDFTYAAFDVEE